MTDKDFKNIEDIKRILKYINNGKLDPSAWSVALELSQSLTDFLAEYKELEDHMKSHH